MVKNSKKSGAYDCGTCQGRSHKCLLAGKPFAVAVPGRPNMGRYNVSSTADIPAMLAWARGNPGHADLPDLAILRGLGVCPVPLVTPLSVECMNLYHYGQVNNSFALVPGGYYDQPAFYMAAMNLIAAEESRIRAEKTEADNG